MECPTCHKNNPDDARFCGHCRTPISAAEDKETSIESPISNPEISSDNEAVAELPRIGFSDAIVLGFKRYFDFRSRATRAEYWWWALFSLGTALILTGVDMGIGTYNYDSSNGLLSGVFRLAILIPSFALGARRLHDINRSGWWQLLWLVLLIGWIILIVWATRKGDEGPNQHGSDPKDQAYQS